MFRSIVAAAALLLSASLVPIRAATLPRTSTEAIVRKAPPHAHRLTFGQALRMIWGMAGNGARLYEAGFAVDRAGDGYVIVLAPMTYEPDMELAIPFNAVGKTVLIAHTHPDESSDRPSEGDARRRSGDVYSPVPNYVVSRSGLWVTDPKTATCSRVARKHWESFSAPELEPPASFIPIAPRLRKQIK